MTRTPYILFDFDGTLVDSNGVVIEEMESFLAREGLDGGPDFIERAKTKGPAVLNAELAAMTGGKYTPTQVEAIFDRNMVDFYAHRAQAKPGVCTCVRALRAAGVRLAVASCTGERDIRRCMKRLGIEDCFEFVADPAATGVDSKSDPEFFRRACAMFPVEASKQVTLYDDARSSLQAAGAAGLRTVAVADCANANCTSELKALCDGYLETFQHIR